jgi:hypothetical protein
MAIHCPSCGKIRIPAPREIGIGEPFVRCRKCGTVFLWLRSNEWRLMTSPEKKSHVLVMMTCPVIWALVAVAFIAVVDWWCFGHPNYILQPVFVATAACAALIVTGIIVIAKMVRDIRRSDRRLADPQYRAQLRELGILKNHE